MKRSAFALVLLTAYSYTARADVFQFKIRFGEGLSDLSYAVVRVPKDPDFRGRTDKLGRIKLDLPRGTYDVRLTQDQKEYKATVTINGAKAVKAVVAKP